ncbi:aldo/keto reductase [Halogeometricum sp. S1BR25-6]|uniref:Aldo/keto reductase n=1 Tax=Halogeometricum salsisoli TaxID=2950536 RepID=A0ABU2GCL3_9EURY|nr:aldo/keto reductase [Halogeometricum sp. S1BR25-6]MDS0298548.1 aldo/keto reductase [Halogeometricum sp. S1BR25-6]
MTTLDLPDVGYGTGGATKEDVVRALRVGYRHLDTAQMYENEADVGEAVAESDVDRDDIVLATKVRPENLAPEDVKRTAKESLDRLGVEKVEMLYVHWPTAAYDAEETLPALDELREEGLVDHVCLSNFTPALLDETREVLESPVAAHQVECHPLFPQEELRAYAEEHDHRLVAYVPLARGEIFDHPVVSEVAERRGASAAQVCLAWAVEKGVVPIPKGSGDHAADNLAATEVGLDRADLEKLDGIEERRRVVDPETAPWNRA